MLEQWDTEFVNNNLLEQGYHPTNVIRYFNGNGFPTPLVLVLFPIQERDKVFHELKAINGIRIRVETQKSKTRSTQCHRCQLFGHSQSRCTADPKFVKCAGNHQSTSCQKPPNTEATCANCGGNHPASYQGCPRHPKQATNQRKTLPPPTRTFKWGSQDNRKLAAASTTPATAKQKVTPDIMSMVANLQQQMASLLQTLNLNPAHIHG